MASRSDGPSFSDRVHELKVAVDLLSETGKSARAVNIRVQNAVESCLEALGRATGITEDDSRKLIEIKNKYETVRTGGGFTRKGLFGGDATSTTQDKVVEFYLRMHAKDVRDTQNTFSCSVSGKAIQAGVVAPFPAAGIGEAVSETVSDLALSPTYRLGKVAEEIRNIDYTISILKTGFLSPDCTKDLLSSQIKQLTTVQKELSRLDRKFEGIEARFTGANKPYLCGSAKQQLQGARANMQLAILLCFQKISEIEKQDPSSFRHMHFRVDSFYSHLSSLRQELGTIQANLTATDSSPLTIKWTETVDKLFESYKESYTEIKDGMMRIANGEEIDLQQFKTAIENYRNLVKLTQGTPLGDAIKAKGEIDFSLSRKDLTDCLKYAEQLGDLRKKHMSLSPQETIAQRRTSLTNIKGSFERLQDSIERKESLNGTVLRTMFINENDNPETDQSIPISAEIEVIKRALESLPSASEEATQADVETRILANTVSREVSTRYERIKKEIIRESRFLRNQTKSAIKMNMRAGLTTAESELYPDSVSSTILTAPSQRWDEWLESNYPDLPVDVLAEANNPEEAFPLLVDYEGRKSSGLPVDRKVLEESFLEYVESQDTLFGAMNSILPRTLTSREEENALDSLTVKQLRRELKSKCESLSPDELEEALRRIPGNQNVENLARNLKLKFSSVFQRLRVQGVLNGAAELVLILKAIKEYEKLKEYSHQISGRFLGITEDRAYQLLKLLEDSRGVIEATFYLSQHVQNVLKQLKVLEQGVKLLDFELNRLLDSFKLPENIKTQIKNYYISKEELSVQLKKGGSLLADHATLATKVRRIPPQKRSSEFKVNEIGLKMNLRLKEYQELFTQSKKRDVTLDRGSLGGSGGESTNFRSSGGARFSMHASVVQGLVDKNSAGYLAFLGELISDHGAIMSLGNDDASVQLKMQITDLLIRAHTKLKSTEISILNEDLWYTLQVIVKALPKSFTAAYTEFEDTWTAMKEASSRYNQLYNDRLEEKAVDDEVQEQVIKQYGLAYRSFNEMLTTHGADILDLESIYIGHASQALRQENISEGMKELYKGIYQDGYKAKVDTMLFDIRATGFMNEKTLRYKLGMVETLRGVKEGFRARIAELEAFRLDEMSSISEKIAILNDQEKKTIAQRDEIEEYKKSNPGKCSVQVISEELVPKERKAPIDDFSTEIESLNICLDSIQRLRAQLMNPPDQALIEKLAKDSTEDVKGFLMKYLSNHERPGHLYVEREMPVPPQLIDQENRLMQRFLRQPSSLDIDIQTRLDAMKVNQEGWQNSPEYSAWEDWVTKTYNNMYTQREAMPSDVRRSDEALSYNIRRDVQATLEVLCVAAKVPQGERARYKQSLWNQFTNHVLTEQEKTIRVKGVKDIEEVLDASASSAWWMDWIEERCGKHSSRVNSDLRKQIKGSTENVALNLISAHVSKYANKDLLVAKLNTDRKAKVIDRFRSRLAYTLTPEGAEHIVSTIKTLKDSGAPCSLLDAVRVILQDKIKDIPTQEGKIAEIQAYFTSVLGAPQKRFTEKEARLFLELVSEKSKIAEQYRMRETFRLVEECVSPDGFTEDAGLRLGIDGRVLGQFQDHHFTRDSAQAVLNEKDTKDNFPSYAVASSSKREDSRRALAEIR